MDQPTDLAGARTSRRAAPTAAPAPTSATKSILGDIYEAAIRPSHWAVVLEQIVHALDARGAILRTFEATPESAGLWFAHRIPQSSIEEYVQRYHALDVWETNAHAKGLMTQGSIHIGDMLVPREEFLACEFYRDFLKRYDILDLLAIIVHDGKASPMPLTVLSIFRGHEQPRFGQSEVSVARQYVEHLARAVELNFYMAELRHRAAAYGLAFEQFSPAMVFFNRAGVVINANRQAQMLIAAADGILLREGHLAASNTEDDARLQRLLAGDGLVTHGEADVARISRPSGRLPYAAVRVAVPQDSRDPPDARRAHFVILLHDPSVPAELDLDALQRIYGLTPAEQRLVQALADHGSLKSILHRTDLNGNTLRSQIKSVLKKTGTRSQGELIRLALTIALRAPVFDTKAPVPLYGSPPLT